MRLQRAFNKMGLMGETLDPNIMTTVEAFIRDVELSDSIGADWSSESDSSSTPEHGTRGGTVNLPPPHDHLDRELAPNVGMD